jgi:hypothetical protein
LREDDHVLPALLTVVACALIAGGAYVSTAVLGVAVFVVQLALVLTWRNLLRTPGGRGVELLAVLTAGAADILLIKYAGDSGLTAALGVMGLVVPLSFLLQVLGRNRRPGAVADIASTVMLCALSLMCAGWIALKVSQAGADGVLIAVAAIAATAVVASLLDPRAIGLVLGVAVGVGVGLLVAWLVDGPSPSRALAIAAASAVMCAVAVRFRRVSGRSARHAALTTAALPLALAAPVAYLVAAVVVG